MAQTSDIRARGIDWRANARHWGVVSKGLHWIMALMIVAMLAVGFYMTSEGLSRSVRFDLYQMHKSFGFTVMALAVLRLVWRLTCEKTPTLPAGMPTWQRAGSHISHVLLYGLMIIMPLSGWLMVSATTRFRFDTLYFELFKIPHLMGPNEVVYDAMKAAHGTMAFVFIALLVVHVAAALKHHVIERDTVLRRILPGRLT